MRSPFPVILSVAATVRPAALVTLALVPLLGACPSDVPTAHDSAGTDGSTDSLGDSSTSGPNGTDTSQPTTATTPTSADTTDTMNTDGCIPGVFGSSVFGEACFQ
jgi:hypothetical protein